MVIYYWFICDFGATWPGREKLEHLLSSTNESQHYVFSMTREWVNDVRMILFGWTIPLTLWSSRFSVFYLTVDCIVRWSPLVGSWCPPGQMMGCSSRSRVAACVLHLKAFAEKQLKGFSTVTQRCRSLNTHQGLCIMCRAEHYGY